MKKVILFTMMLFAFASLSNAQNCTTPTFKSVVATSKTTCTITVSYSNPNQATCGAIYVKPAGSNVYISMNTPPYPCSSHANPAFVAHYNANDPSQSYMDAVVNKSYVAGGTTYQLKKGDNFYFIGYCNDVNCTPTAPSPVYELKFKGN